MKVERFKRRASLAQHSQNLNLFSTTLQMRIFFCEKVLNWSSGLKRARHLTPSRSTPRIFAENGAGPRCETQACKCRCSNLQVFAENSAERRSAGLKLGAPLPRGPAVGPTFANIQIYLFNRFNLMYLGFEINRWSFPSKPWGTTQTSIIYFKA